MDVTEAVKLSLAESIALLDYQVGCGSAPYEKHSQQAAERIVALLVPKGLTPLERELLGALASIDDLCTEELNIRFSDSALTQEEVAGTSRVYSLLVLPRDIARAAIAKAKAVEGEAP